MRGIEIKARISHLRVDSGVLLKRVPGLTVIVIEGDKKASKASAAMQGIGTLCRKFCRECGALLSYWTVFSSLRFNSSSTASDNVIIFASFYNVPLAKSHTACISSSRAALSFSRAIIWKLHDGFPIVPRRVGCACL